MSELERLERLLDYYISQLVNNNWEYGSVEYLGYKRSISIVIDQIITYRKRK